MRLEIFLLDLKGLLIDFRMQDLGPMLFWGLWIGALLASLRGVDRRDEIAQVTYMGALMALGVTVLLVLPQHTGFTYGPIGKMVVVFIVLLIPSVRWMFVKKRTVLEQAMQKAMSSGNAGKTKRGA